MRAVRARHHPQKIKIAPENGWVEHDRFLLGWPPGSVLTVRFREAIVGAVLGSLWLTCCSQNSPKMDGDLAVICMPKYIYIYIICIYIYILENLSKNTVLNLLKER